MGPQPSTFSTLPILLEKWKLPLHQSVPSRLWQATLLFPLKPKKTPQSNVKGKEIQPPPTTTFFFPQQFPPWAFSGISTGSPKQTLVQWQLLLTSQGDQMAHLSTKEKEELLRAREEEKLKNGTKTERLHFSLRTLSLLKSLLLCFSKPLWSGRQQNEGLLQAKQRAKMGVVSMASRKYIPEEQGCKSVPLPSPYQKLPAHVSSSKSGKNCSGACKPSQTSKSRPGTLQQELTCDAEIRDTSCRPVRSDEETLAGAPRCNLMLTFRSLSTLEIALGDVLPVGAEKCRDKNISQWLWFPANNRGR